MGNLSCRASSAALTLICQCSSILYHLGNVSVAHRSCTGWVADLSKALPPTRVPSRALYTPSASTDSPTMSVVRRSVSVSSDVTPAPRCLPHGSRAMSGWTLQMLSMASCTGLLDASAVQACWENGTLAIQINHIKQSAKYAGSGMRTGSSPEASFSDNPWQCHQCTNAVGDPGAGGCMGRLSPKGGVDGFNNLLALLL